MQEILGSGSGVCLVYMEYICTGALSAVTSLLIYMYRYLMKMYTLYPEKNVWRGLKKIKILVDMYIVLLLGTQKKKCHTSHI